MKRLVGIGEAASALGVSITTLRRWEASGKLKAEHTAGGHRRYDLAKLKPELIHAASADNRRTVAYARVSSHDQKEDLERQKHILELYCARQGWTFEIISDLGSGLNCKKPGLKKLLEAIWSGTISSLTLTHADRLLRFGKELVFYWCKQFNVSVKILDDPEGEAFETELVKDVITLMAVFSARLYGKRSWKNRRALEQTQSNSVLTGN